MSTPLYQLKADFFKTLGHRARIRVLELLSQRDYAVAEMLPQVGIEAAHLSQQLAVLRRSNLVISHKQGSTVYYSLTSPQVAELLAVARQIHRDHIGWGPFPRLPRIDTCIKRAGVATVRNFTNYDVVIYGRST